MKYTGKIIKILPLEQIGEKKTNKRTIVLEQDGDSEYKGGLVFDIRGDRITLIDGYNEGDVITVSLNAKAREYKERWYNSLSGWKIEGSPNKLGGEEDIPF